ncbi:Hypothetical protein, putative [Schistosoma mansoni]|uniref:Hypothetical protein, putative n=1 Tax=Schistosoma mansoni TaxID=6183 RepID=UPI00022C8701|nr:Hypothetical protein, putative [Schistosoma mansoni]|eukprot:XP_018646612.1 Hypothetical protein, putative [Schistosoma mansoni]
MTKGLLMTTPSKITIMNESNESIKLEGSMYTSVMTTTTLFVALFWTSITLLSWLLRNLLLWVTWHIMVLLNNILLLFKSVLVFRFHV